MLQPARLELAELGNQGSQPDHGKRPPICIMNVC